MSTIKNRVQLIGFLGGDPEIINLENDKKIAKFSLATNESYKDGQGKKVAITQWHNVVCWNGLANLAEDILSKGKSISLSGSLNYKTYENKEGNKVKETEIVADEFFAHG